MTGKTHKQYAICGGLIAGMLMYGTGFTEVNYYLSLPILVMASQAGGKFPDLDHNWENVKDKNIVTKIVNTLIHITGGKHRSWQTHSWDICILATALAWIIPGELQARGTISITDKELLMVVLTGFMSGWVSHLLSDMLTTAGVRLFCWNKKMVKFVPKKMLGVKFTTNSMWEEFNYNGMRAINVLLAIACVTFPLFCEKADTIINNWLLY